jgi:hypothetical protein
VEEDFDSIISFQPYTVGEYFFEVGGKGRVNTFGRIYALSVQSIVERFGYEKSPSYVRTLYDNSSYTHKFPIRTIIEPVSTGEFEGVDLPKEFTYRAVHYAEGENSENFLEVSGYHGFPVLAPRWSVLSGDAYGYGPASDAFGDAKAVQIKERELAKGIAKAVNPPIKAPTSMKEAPVSLLPGGITYTDDVNNVFQSLYQVNSQTAPLVNDITRTEHRINEAMYVTVFQMISSMQGVQPRNAEEIAARQEEKLIAMGPVLERLRDELLEPLIDRTFDRLMRLSLPGWQGMGPMMLPPMPEELADQEIKVEYVSVLAQAQKMVKTGSTERWLGFVGNLSNFKPEVLDKVNADAVVDNMGEDLGVPQDNINSKDQVAAIREQRAQAQAAQAQADAAMASVAAAKELGNAKTTGETALGSLLGG